ncbi:MAG: 4-hydroxy-3-methylbut-2-enyl diphosphate reductase [Candidatus Methanosuratincola sp.]|jgi:4-hydroxy-3-methylbut-2-enyl diphosphate reductase
MGSRKIILAESAGVCFGVERALEKSFQVLSDGESSPEPVYSLGPIIHNPQVVGRLEGMGVKVIGRIEEASRGTVMIRAHGVPVNTRRALRERGLRVVDLTCPIVKKLQHSVKRLNEEGYFILIVGDERHPEIIGAVSYANPENIAVVSSSEDIPPRVFHEKRVGVVAQTTIAFGRFREVVDELLAREVPEIKVFNTICDDIFNKQREAVDIAKRVEVMFVIGGKNSSNTTKIAKLCREVNPRTYQIETLEEVRSLGLDLSDKVIGVTAGASTPSWIINEILSGLESL